MRLWLDDVRPAPKDWQWAKTADEAISFLESGLVIEISFDHDLGEGKSGYDVACWIEENAAEGKCKRLAWHIHSANPVGRKKILAAMNMAERFWKEKGE